MRKRVTKLDRLVRSMKGMSGRDFYVGYKPGNLYKGHPTYTYCLMESGEQHTPWRSSKAAVYEDIRRKVQEA